MTKRSDNKTLAGRVTAELEAFWSARPRTKVIVIFLTLGFIWISFSEVFRIPRLKETIDTQRNENGKQASEIQRLETLLAPFRTIALEKYTGSEREVLDKLAAELLELKLKTHSLERTIAPRNLTSEQKAKLIESLSFESKSQVIVACRMMDDEGYRYAEQIAEVFRRARWRVGPTNRSFLDDVEADVVLMTTDSSQKEDANRVAVSLNSAGLRCELGKIRSNAISAIKRDAIYLIVGSKSAAAQKSASAQ